MSYIDDLIKECCPDGVEWKELGEVCEFKRGQSLTSKMAVAGDVPVISGGQKPAFMHNTPNREGETIVVAGSGAYAGFVSYWDKPIFVSDAFSVDIKNLHEVSVRYVFHFLLNNQQKIYATKLGAGIPHVYGKNIAKFLIPIPPLEIQEEIVKILDKFTEYVTELTAELTDRQKQYTYYRDKLLSFEDEVYQVEWKTLGEVGLPTENISWKSQGEQCFSYIDLSSVDRDSKKITETTEITKYTAPSRAQKIVKENDIIFGTTRPTLRRYAKIPLEFDNQICSTGFYVFRASDEVLPNYIYHIFGSNAFNNFVEENQSGASYPAISNNLVEQYKLPVPSKKVQSRIVQVLDNFDAVCNDLNIGLPKEIELRQKQYEYFRDKLLTFAAEGVYTDSTDKT